MKKVTILLAITALILSSCLYTLHPIFKPNDLVFDSRLLGSWQKKGDNEGEITIYEKLSEKDRQGLTDELRKKADDIYLVTHKEDSKIKDKYLGFLVKLGKNYFMDFYPYEEEMNIDPFFKTHLIKMHGIYKIQIDGDNSFELKQFADSYMKKLIQNKQIRIQHEAMDDGDFIITASTEDLQQYILKYSEISEAYDSGNTFIKLK